MNGMDALTDASGQLAGRPLSEWNAAYAKVENYFHAMRVRNKALLGQLVLRVLERAQRRAPAEPQLSATQLAAEEMDRIVTEWFAEVLQESPAGGDQMLSTRGRLALLLVDMPGRWQDQFLRPGPWPAEFTNAMRETYLRAGAGFSIVKNDAPPARPRSDHDADESGADALRPHGRGVGIVCAAVGGDFHADPPQLSHARANAPSHTRARRAWLAVVSILFIRPVAHRTGFIVVRRPALAHGLVNVPHRVADFVRHPLSAGGDWLHARCVWFFSADVRHPPAHHEAEKLSRPEN